MINIVEGGITAAKGFRAAAVNAGISAEERPDLCLIASTVPCVFAGTFTANQIKGAPVRWDEERAADECAAQAIVVNSGIANVCMGDDSMRWCGEIAEAVSSGLLISPESVLLASTGIIGRPLPIERILEQADPLIRRLDDSPEAAALCAEAILTTDSVRKERAVKFTLSDGTVATLGGCAKGSGMVHPDMSTMLAFLTTDVSISRELLSEALMDDVRETYNMISTDGDMSPNDTVLILANGLCGNAEIRDRGADYQRFCEVLHELNAYFAKKIAQDGEGAKALLCCRVLHAPDKEGARRLARAVISSPSVKKAVGGHSPDWGRILSALGNAGVPVDMNVVDLFCESRAGHVTLLKGGRAFGASEAQIRRIFSESEITILVDLGSGAADATAWGCDLTREWAETVGID